MTTQRYGYPGLPPKFARDRLRFRDITQVFRWIAFDTAINAIAMMLAVNGI